MTLLEELKATIDRLRRTADEAPPKREAKREAANLMEIVRGLEPLYDLLVARKDAAASQAYRNLFSGYKHVMPHGLQILLRESPEEDWSQHSYEYLAARIELPTIEEELEEKRQEYQDLVIRRDKAMQVLVGERAALEKKTSGASALVTRGRKGKSGR